MIIFHSVQNKLSNTQRVIKIGYREAQVLDLLLKHSPEVVKKPDIIQHAWGSEYIGETSLAKSISTLRQVLLKLGAKESPIVTVPKVGYRLVSHCIEYAPADPPPQVDKSSPAPNLPTSTVISSQSVTSNLSLKECKSPVCYVAAIALLFASSILALSKVHGWRWEDIPSDQHLARHTVGQLQVFTESETRLSLPLRQLLSQNQCDCVVYIEKNERFSELSWLDRQRRQSINVFYAPGQLKQVSAQVERFIQEGQQ
ncbi:winged helix-turn-helix domain-containing protein [Vibrio coralliilyticus]|uniref:winged helix-turn-helix domain-containing protein n=1 Tax=Vibrio coralliilyticus TaxID=190893 RepID=UPI000BAAD8AE|nr:winged helix-turn-helix domain-containing protein [Vibrio coralliilyticus]NOI60012.1 transcriptional regulator [Vibrio coralliilyticus]PAT65668.1 transcriptional regulator [Vibrio coralliilyticus]